MKSKVLMAVSAALLLFAGCSVDNDLVKKVDEIDSRVTALEEKVKELNSLTIPGLQSIVASIEGKIYVTAVAPSSEGYVITFSNGTTAVIKNGKDGDKGDKGDAPQISVVSVDGEFYWAIDGTPVLDPQGNKVPVNGGTPQLRINQGKWEVSYDKGQTWQVVEQMGDPSGSTISIEDGETTVTFYINGEAYEIQKELPFYITFEKRTDIAIFADDPTAIPYTLVGAREGDEIEVDILNIMGDVKASVVSLPAGDTPGYLKVQGTTGKIFVYASNGKGKTDIKSLVFEEGEFSAEIDVKSVPAAGGEVIVTVVTNLDYELWYDKTQTWLAPAPETKAVHTDIITFVAEPNTTGAFRSSEIDVILTTGDAEEFVVLQYPDAAQTTDIASLANVANYSNVTLYNVTALASSEYSAVVSDGTANLYCVGLEMPIGAVVNVTGTKMPSEDGGYYLEVSNVETVSETSTVTDGDPTYYGLAGSYALPLYTTVTGPLVAEEGVYTVTAFEGQKVWLEAPLATYGIDELVDGYVNVRGYVVMTGEFGEDEVYMMVVNSADKFEPKVNTGWTLSYKYDPEEYSASYPECITNTVNGTTVPFMISHFTKAEWEELAPAGSIISTVDDYQYTNWFMSALFGFTWEELNELLIHNTTYTETFGEFEPGEYVGIAVGMNPDGTPTGDYQICEFEKTIPDYEMDITVTDITHESATATFTPSNNVTYYLPAVESTAWVDEFDTLEELAQADLDYWYNKYGTSYASYGFDSYVDLLLNGLCSQGVYNWEVEDLDPETKYYAYAFAVDAEGKLASDVEITSFTTEAAPESHLEFYGTAIWHDVFVDSWFGMAEDGYNIDLDCDVYVDSSKPGYYYFDSPYWYDNIAEWFDSTPEEMKQYTGNYKEAMIEINCSDPNAVSMARQELGVSLSSNYGWFSAGFTGADGIFADNVISCRGDKMVKSMARYNNGGWYYVSNPSADDADKLTFTVTITPGGSPVKPASVAVSARKGASKAAFNALAIDAKMTSKLPVEKAPKSAKVAKKKVSMDDVKAAKANWR